MSRDRQAARAVKIAYAQRFLTVLVTIGSTAVLSRLLAPAQFGYAATAVTVMNFLIVFRDFGLTTTTIQKPVLEDSERDALFWMNAAIVTVISLLAVVIAPAVGRLYANPSLTSLMSLAAVGFFLSGIVAQHAAVLRRAVAYEKLFVAEFGGILVGAGTSIALAFVLRNAYALVLGSLSQALFTAAALVVLLPWRPRRPARLGSDLALLVFGGHVAVFTACNFVTNNIAVLLLGVSHASSTVGLYNRAQSLYEMPRSYVLGPFLQVQFIFLCQDSQDSVASRARYLHIVKLTGLFFIPAAMTIPVVAHELVRVLLGPQWLHAGDILSALMPALAGLGVVACFGQFLTSLGKVSELRRWGYADVLIRGGGTAIGCASGALGAAIGFSLSTLLIAAPIQIFLLSRLTNVSVRDQIGAIAPGVVAGVAALAGALAGSWISATLLHGSAFAAAVTAIILAGCGWAMVAAGVLSPRGTPLLSISGAKTLSGT